MKSEPLSNSPEGEDQDKREKLKEKNYWLSLSGYRTSAISHQTSNIEPLNDQLINS